MMRLKVGNEFLDGTIFVAQTLAVSNLGEVTTRQGSFSNSFTVDNTSKNRRLLGFSSEINSNERAPYKRLSAELFDGRSYVVKGYLKIESFSSKEGFECSFFAGNTGWFTLIKSRTLKDLDLSDLDHDWTETNIANSQSNTDGYIYPFIDYGNFPKGNKFRAINFYPAVYVSTIFEEIFKATGFEIEGEMLDLPIYKKAIIPFVNKKFSATQQFVNDNIVTDSLGVSSQTVVANSGEFVEFSGGTKTNNVAIETLYTINVTINLSSNDITAGSTFFTFTMFKNGDDVKGAGRDIFVFDKDSATGTYKTSISDAFYFLPTDDIEIFCAANISNTEEITFDQFDVEFVPSNIFQPGSTIKIADILPDMTQSDFIKYIMNVTGAYATTNTTQTRITFNLFRNIKRRINDAVDWSNKISISNSRVIDFSELLQDYGKKSLFQYKEDDEDEELKAYESANDTRFGSGILQIDNEHISERKEIYEAPFSPCINVLAFNNSLYVPQIRLMEGGGSEIDIQEVKSGPGTVAEIETTDAHDLEVGKYVEIEGTTDYNGVFVVTQVIDSKTFTVNVPYVSDQSGTVRKLASIENTVPPKILLIETGFDVEELTAGNYISLSIGGPNQTEIPFAWFAKAAYTESTDALTGSLSFGDIAFTSSVEGVLSSFWKEYKELLSNMKFLKASLHLTSADIATLDFSKPVYIRHYNAYFYINSVNEFTGSDQLTEVELIRIQ